MREWLVIESAMKHAVFAPDELRDRKGYIPRDVAEALLGRDLGDLVFFTRDESAKMRAHPEWRDTEPPETTAAVIREVVMDDTWFHLQCFRSDDSDGTAIPEGLLDLDDFQVIFDPDNKQIRINLSGEQVNQIKATMPILMARLLKPPQP